MTAITTVTIGHAPRISVDVAGAGDLLVCLHGIGGNKRNWHCNFPAFADHFRIAAWDARGYGDSDDYQGPFDFDLVAGDLARVLDGFGAARAHVMGLSMGGRIAMEFARLFPDRLLSLTLCATNSGFDVFTPEERRAFVASRKAPLVAGLAPRDIAFPVARSLISGASAVTALDQMVDSIGRLHKDSYIKAIEALVELPPCRSLAEIAVPVHVICGAQDPLTTPDQSRELAALIPGAKLTFIPLAGHLVNIEQVEAFDQAALGFLRAI